VLLGEKNLSHLRRCGILAGALTQRSPFGYAQGRRAGLICAAPPALGTGGAAGGPPLLKLRRQASERGKRPFEAQGKREGDLTQSSLRTQRTLRSE
jgi:hypothetical protein